MGPSRVWRRLRGTFAVVAGLIAGGCEPTVVVVEVIASTELCEEPRSMWEEPLLRITSADDLTPVCASGEPLFLGCDLEIAGNLVAGPGLECLVGVTGDLIVVPQSMAGDGSERPRPLAGLRNLRRIDRRLRLDEAPPTITSLEGLDSLATLGAFDTGPHVTEVHLPVLTSLGSVSTGGSGVEHLDLPALTQAGELTLAGPELRSVRLPVLRSAPRVVVRDAPSLQDVALGPLDGSLAISGVPALEEVSFALGTRLTALALTGLPSASLTNPIGFAEETAPTFSVERTDLLDLPEIEPMRPPARVFVTENPRMENLDGLAGVTDLIELVVEDNPALQAPRGLDSLRTVELLRLQRNGLTSLRGLGALEDAITLVIEEEDALTNLDGLDALRSTRLRVERNLALESFEGLDAIEQVGSLRVRLNRSLRSLDALHVLEGIDDELHIEGNIHLSVDTIEAFIEAIGGRDAVGGEVVLGGNGSEVD